MLVRGAPLLRDPGDVGEGGAHRRPRHLGLRRCLVPDLHALDDLGQAPFAVVFLLDLLVDPQRVILQLHAGDQLAIGERTLESRADDRHALHVGCIADHRHVEVVSHLPGRLAPEQQCIDEPVDHCRNGVSFRTLRACDPTHHRIGLLDQEDDAARVAAGARFRIVLLAQI